MSEVNEGVAVARDYYDSAEADGFYSAIWGGEDIHVGLYDETDDIRDASRRTVESMIARVGDLAGKRVVDLGSGYGGAARVLASRGAHVTCLNLSAVENERNRALNAEAGLADKIDVIDGSYDAMPFEAGSFDIAWSQDAILHAPDRFAVLDEVARVLRPGGLFVFHDPMQADGLTDTSALKPIYERIHLPDLASIGFYRDALVARDFEEVEVDELTHQLGRHYARVREELLSRQQELGLPEDFVTRMAAGLGHWVDGAANGNLRWAIMVYRKKA
ncbi:SAM-dependent methyltransferase [Novosphingobium sp. PC22D]|uniref:SAM-dependent methyltransferase n=1 Tax=Novosphingobium sp. PC22D TaxID=1962403 RepID=UPI000BFAEC5C|nr:methyltransferase domain-containing protein [Novosphingobium sp. PC22D]PEQ14492.1 SAM-dependent methyltransferase [Novosphingobium sp. PC22D]